MQFIELINLIYFNYSKLGKKNFLRLGFFFFFKKMIKIIYTKFIIIIKDLELYLNKKLF